MSAIDEALDQLDLVQDMRGCARLKRGRNKPKSIVSLGELAFKPGRPCPPRLPGLGRLVQDFVINIRNVSDVGDLHAVLL